MRAWNKLRWAHIQRFIVGWIIILAVFYLAAYMLINLGANNALRGAEPGPLGLRAKTVNLADRDDLYSLFATATPGMRDFFNEIVEGDLQMPDRDSQVLSYYFGDCLVFYTVIHDGAQEETLYYTDCSQLIGTLRTMKWVIVAAALFTVAVAAVISHRVTREIRRDVALSEELSQRLFHEMKGPLTSLVMGQSDYEDSAGDEDIHSLADAFDNLMRFRDVPGGDQAMYDAREVVFEVARSLDKHAESPEASVAVVASQPIEIVCNEDRLASTLYCIASLGIAMQELTLFATAQDAHGRVGVSWCASNVNTVSDEVVKLARSFAQVEGCKVDTKDDEGSFMVCFCYPLSNR